MMLEFSAGLVIGGFIGMVFGIVLLGWVLIRTYEHGEQKAYRALLTALNAQTEDERKSILREALEGEK